MPGEQSAPPVERSSWQGLRFTSGATLVGLALVITLIALTIAFPRFGMPPSSTGFLYFPPQAYCVVITVPMTAVYGFITVFQGISESRRARRYGWAAVFIALLALLAAGPAYVIVVIVLRLSDASLLPYVPGLTSPDAPWVLAWFSAAALALTGVCGLIISWSVRETAR